MVVDETDALHEGIDDRRPDERGRGGDEASVALAPRAAR